MTGMGEVTPIGDSGALGEAIARVLRDPGDYGRPRRLVEETFSLERTVSGYEELFQALVAGEARDGQRSQGIEEWGN
jgi:glycosyltransferase involved in cell wall biosynthesis